MNNASIDLPGRRPLQHLASKVRDDSHAPSRRSSISSSAGSIFSDVASLASLESTVTSFSSQESNDFDGADEDYASCAHSKLQTLVEDDLPSVALRVQDGFKIPSVDLAPKFNLPLRPADGHIPTISSTNPRRTFNTHRAKPTLIRDDLRRSAYVENLVDISEQLIAHVWPTSSSPTPSVPQTTICLRYFIREVLRRSRTSHSTLQVALYYCFILWKADRLPHYDGRRLFLSSLVLAYKFLQDRNYSTRAWSSISGLPAQELKRIELAFLQAIDYSLFIKPHDWNEWRLNVDFGLWHARQGLQCPWKGMLDGMLAFQTGGAPSLGALARQRLTLLASRTPTPMLTPPMSPERVTSPELKAENSVTLAALLETQQSQQTPLPSMPSAPRLSPLTSPESDTSSVYGSHTPAMNWPLDVKIAVSALSMPRVESWSDDATEKSVEPESSRIGGWLEENYERVEQHEDKAFQRLEGRSTKGRPVSKSSATGSLRRKRAASGDVATSHKAKCARQQS